MIKKLTLNEINMRTFWQTQFGTWWKWLWPLYWSSTCKWYCINGWTILLENMENETMMWHDFADMYYKGVNNCHDHVTVWHQWELLNWKDLQSLSADGASTNFCQPLEFNGSWKALACLHGHDMSPPPNSKFTNSVSK